jgi:ABC-type transport system involved in multi-copper enzyme maturation permease subunit
LDQNPVLWREWHRRRARGLGAVILFLYVAGSIVFPAWVIWRGTATSGGLSRSVVEIEAIFTSGFQVSFGLLFLTMAAATALAEERVRGSLDEVMATPLSTRSLVLGKWWGSCRWGILIAIPAAAITTAKALERNGNLGYVAAVVALVLAYSAGFSSMALLFATWIRGTGRAIAASLFVYLLITVGWFFLILFIANHEMGAGIVSLSPFYGVMYPLVYGIYRVDDSSGVVPFVCLWVWVYLTIAAVCLVLAVATFDRCVGRVPASPHGPDDPDRAREWRAGVDRAGASHAGTATLAAR